VHVHINWGCGWVSQYKAGQMGRGRAWRQSECENVKSTLTCWTGITLAEGSGFPQNTE
jgi:hypothetical protein